MNSVTKAQRDKKLILSQTTSIVVSINKDSRVSLLPY